MEKVTGKDTDEKTPIQLSREQARAKAAEAKLKRGYKKAQTGFATEIEWTEVGQTFEGIYTKLKTGVGENSSNIYILKQDDSYHALWGSVQVDQAFADIPFGSEVYIEFRGIEKVEGKKREMKLFQILYREPKLNHGETDNTGIEYSKGRPSKRVPI